LQPVALGSLYLQDGVGLTPYNEEVFCSVLATSGAYSLPVAAGGEISTCCLPHATAVGFCIKARPSFAPLARPPTILGSHLLSWNILLLAALCIIGWAKPQPFCKVTQASTWPFSCSWSQTLSFPRGMSWSGRAGCLLQGLFCPCQRSQTTHQQQWVGVKGALQTLAENALLMSDTAVQAQLGYLFLGYGGLFWQDVQMASGTPAPSQGAVLGQYPRMRSVSRLGVIGPGVAWKSFGRPYRWLQQRAQQLLHLHQRLAEVGSISAYMQEEAGDLHVELGRAPFDLPPQQQHMVDLLRKLADGISIRHACGFQVELAVRVSRLAEHLHPLKHQA